MPKTLQEGFETMMRTVLPDGCPDAEYVERQATFIAGAATMLALMRAASDIKDEKGAMEAIDALQREIRAFANAMGVAAGPDSSE